MKLIVSLCLIFFSASIYGQSIAVEGSDAQKQFEKEYQANIKLTKIRGVYIPATVDEALIRIEKLSPPAAMSKFHMAPEVEVSAKLHFGIGRWMIQNWNFYTGSRISHELKTKGVLHPDDMAQFLLRSLHRKLNNNPLDEELLIEELAKSRKKIASEALGL